MDGETVNAKKSKSSKVERGEPVSLHPLDPEEALKAILQVKAPEEARSQKNRSKVKSPKKTKRRKKPKSG